MNRYAPWALAGLIVATGCAPDSGSGEVSNVGSESQVANVAPGGPLDIKRIVGVVNSEAESREAATNATETYAWDLFVFMNWPAKKSDRSVPDESAAIGDEGPRTWEGQKQTSDVFLADGARPNPFGARDAPPRQVLEMAKSKGLPIDEPFHNLDEEVQVDGLSLADKAGNPIRYQILMNDVTFDYVRTNGLYNINGQEAVAAGTGPIQKIDFNWDAIEVKTSWLWLDPSNPDAEAIAFAYLTVNAYHETVNDDGSHRGWEVQRAALTGMHIITKALDNWVWTTFEHVDNAKYTTAKIELPIPEGVANANVVYQKALAGTVFAKYQLVGTQTRFTAGGQPTLLANSQIESAFQHTSSCITCHAMASIAREPGIPPRFPFIDTSEGNVKYYVGDPPDLAGYAEMNFVWSLRRAKRAR